MPFTFFSGQNLFDGPTLVKAGVKRLSWHTETLSPLRYREVLAVESQTAIAAGITGLLLRRGPAAIAQFVISIIVNTIKRVGGTRPRPHIVVESLKRIAPPGTDLNTASAVVGISRSRWIRASLNHMRPNGILWRMNLSMMFLRFRPVADTPTTSSVSPCKAVLNDCDASSAVTTANPIRVSCFAVPCIAKHYQPTEAAASQVLYTFVRNGYNLVSHVRTSSTNVMRGLSGVRSACQSPLLYHSRTDEQISA